MAADHRFELFLVKREDATYIRGPFWNSFCRSHNIALHDVVTFTLIKKAEEDEDEEGSEDDEDEKGSEKDVQEEKPEEKSLDRPEYVFTMKAHATNGDIKEFHYISGIYVVSHQTVSYTHLTLPTNREV